MPKYLVSFYLNLDFDIEVEAENEDFAIEEAINSPWRETLAHVDISPSDAEVEEIDDPEAV